MCNSFTLIICLILGLGVSTPAYALEAPLSAEISSEAPQALEKSVKTRKKGGLIKGFQAVKALKKGLKQTKAWMQEKVANKSKLALGLFVGAIILFSLGLFISSVLVYAGLIALLASDILSFVILATEEDPKSRKTAKTILWASLALVLIAAILTLLAYLLLLSFIAAIF